MTTEAKERLAVVALDWTGHRLPYLTGVIDAVAVAERRVSVVVDKRARSADEWSAMGDRADGCELIEVNGDRPADVLAELATRFDRLIVLDADRMLLDVVRLAATNRKICLTLQFMREPRLLSAPGESLTPKDRAVGAAKTTLLAALPRLSRGRVRIHLLRSPLFEFGSPARQLERAGVLRPIIDPVLRSADDDPTAPASTALAPSGSSQASVAILGRLDERKYVAEHLAEWERHQPLHDTRLVLCGSSFDDSEIADGVAAAQKAGASVDFPDRFATDAEMDAVIAAATAVVCTYRSDIPSGIAALAVSAGCPIIAMADTRLGSAAQRHGIGAAITHVRGPELVRAIAACAELDRVEVSATAAALHETATLLHFGRQLLNG